MRRKSQRNPAEVLRDEMYMHERIEDALTSEPKTIPELASELNYPSSEVIKWVMALRRYGKIVEMPKSRADDYYRYKSVEEKQC
jgi:predicted Rossmann fold nucleotide-binding protein DprA/Smf involved in DNA uptake